MIIGGWEVTGFTCRYMGSKTRKQRRAEGLRALTSSNQAPEAGEISISLMEGPLLIGPFERFWCTNL